MNVQLAILSHDEWQATLDRVIKWSDYLIEHTMVTPREAFERLAKILENEHFGIESITLENTDDESAAASMEYLNMGDTYATTLILTDDYTNGVRLIISSWGDWYESAEKHYCEDRQVIRCGHCSHFTPFEYGKDDWHNHTCDNCGNNVSG